MIEIRLIDGPLKHLEGFWLFEALSETSCRVQVDIEFEFASGILNFALEPMFHQIMSTMIDAFCERAKEIY